MEVNTFERALIEAFANSATAHQCAQMSFLVSPHGSSSNQELGTRAAQCVAQEFVMSLFLGRLNDQLEVSQGSKRLIGVPMVITDLFQNSTSTKDRMLGHPTRDSLGSVAIAQRFMHNDPDCHVVTRYGPLAEVVRNMGMAVKISRLSHGHNNERSVDSE